MLIYLSEVIYSVNQNVNFACRRDLWTFSSNDATTQSGQALTNSSLESTAEVSDSSWAIASGREPYHLLLWDPSALAQGGDWGFVPAR